MLTPGTYLSKRRQAAGLTLPMVAEQLVALPWAIRRPSQHEVAQLVRRLREAEADRGNLTIIQAQLLRNVYPFDTEAYESLLLHHHTGHGCGLPRPQLCRECGCSWQDPCVSDLGSCAWTRHDPELCTACERTAALAADLGPTAAAAAAELHQGAAA